MDPYNLERFVIGQEGGSWTGSYQTALAEMRAGWKRTHWIWYVFPQLGGMGSSANAVKYGLSGTEEAAAYLDHPVLGDRLRQITGVLLSLPCSDPIAVMSGATDSRKLQACMTLFLCASTRAEDKALFSDALGKFFGGHEHAPTRTLLQETHGQP